jgi:hypothetical protein
LITYLLAGTPAPQPTEPPEGSPSAFLEACRGFVSEARHDDLAAVLVPPDPEAAPATDRVQPNDPAARAWADLAAQVDDAVLQARATRAHRGVGTDARTATGFRSDVGLAVTHAFDAPHPGARERALDALRWRLADELAAAAPDGFAALLARAVQLRLASRRASWDAEAGWAELEATLRRIEGAHA